MHNAALREEVRRLAAAGINDCEIARRLELPRTTVRDIRKGPAHGDRPPCLGCWRPTKPIRFSPGEYAELLGLYLGDGHIVRNGRTYRLRISLDSRYSVLVAEARRLVEKCLPANRVAVVTADRGATAIVSAYSSHLPCLFPQHGPGLKHERRIVLEQWQRDLVREAPWSFLRGLVHSDGCFFINRTGPYAYLSSEFCNLSPDIRALFTEACDAVGVQYRVNGNRVRIYRRESVALMAAFVGLKR